MLGKLTENANMNEPLVFRFSDKVDWVAISQDPLRKGFIWVDKINLEYAKFEVFIKHPNGNVMYAVGTLIERSELEIH